MWVEGSESWPLSQFKGPYAPTVDLLILSSVFSVVVSAILEMMLLFVLRNKSKRTKAWLRYTLYLILSANALLAFAAFLCASLRGATFEEAHASKTSRIIPDGYGHQRGPQFWTWNHSEHTLGVSHGQSSPCHRRIVPLSRWLSLLISLFSTMLSVSAWLDFREQDRHELEMSELNEESLSEKGLISI
ncbi:hypothetical protein F5Y13DRAFT_174315 [Hypoxylon sp. FL1857]|nr:hypothetical protein F5Y13DRAFT_174315 [Hypoxylon sp. FL1857]